MTVKLPNKIRMELTIYITSFKRIHRLPIGVEAYSAAVYQPKGYDLPKADWCDIRMPSGIWIRPRLFVHGPEPLKSYREALLSVYEDREQQAQEWINNLYAKDAALCCWCPYERAAQRQLIEHGSFVCHTAVLGEFLSSTMKQPVFYDSDRLRMAVLTQHESIV